MSTLLPPHNIPRNSNPSRPDAGPILAAYMTALEAYQQQRTAKGRALLLQTYRRWIGAFLDDEGEVDRAANNFLIALRTQPAESQEMGAVA